MPQVATAPPPPPPPPTNKYSPPCHPTLTAATPGTLSASGPRGAVHPPPLPHGHGRGNRFAADDRGGLPPLPLPCALPLRLLASSSSSSPTRMRHHRVHSGSGTDTAVLHAGTQVVRPIPLAILLAARPRGSSSSGRGPNHVFVVKERHGQVGQRVAHALMHRRGWGRGGLLLGHVGGRRHVVGSVLRAWMQNMGGGGRGEGYRWAGLPLPLLLDALQWQHGGGGGAREGSRPGRPVAGHRAATRHVVGTATAAAAAAGTRRGGGGRLREGGRRRGRRRGRKDREATAATAATASSSRCVHAG